MLCVGSLEIASHFVNLRGQRCVRIGRCHSAVPLFGLRWPVLASVGLFSEAAAGSAWLVVGSRSAWVGGLLANQPTANSSIKLNKNDGSYLLISPSLLSSFSLLMTVERCQH